MTPANIYRVKEFVAKKYPSDFERQLSEFENIERLYLENKNLDIEGLVLKTEEDSKENPARSRMLQIPCAKKPRIFLETAFLHGIRR